MLKPIVNARFSAKAYAAFLFVFGVVTLESCVHAGEMEKSDRPNILWIIAEDMGPEINPMGYRREVHTPALTALAEEGVTYTKVFTTAPICSPSRSAIMTGVHATSIGAHNHRTATPEKPALPNGVELLPQYFSQFGYYTSNVKRLVKGADNKQEFYRGTGKKDWNFKFDGKAFDGASWSGLKNNQPFYAQVNLAETHRMLSDWSKAKNHVSSTANPKNVEIPPYYADHPGVRADWAEYLNSVMVVDKKLAFIRDLLKKDGLAENTIVIFFSDHGRAMIRGKQWVYDSGLHIPLIVYVPEKYRKPYADQLVPGSRNGQLLSSLDISATSLALAGIELPKIFHGQSFLSKAAPRQYVFASRDRADEAFERIRSVRDKRFRYIKNFYPEIPYVQRNRYKENVYPVWNLMSDLYQKGQLNMIQSRFFAKTKPVEELYDLVNDPYETINLAADKVYQNDKRRLQLALDDWIKESGDLGVKPEPKSVIEFWEKKLIDFFGP